MTTLELVGFLSYCCVLLALMAVFYGPRFIKWALDDSSEEYRLNVVECHPFAGEAPISFNDYRAKRTVSTVVEAKLRIKEK